MSLLKKNEELDLAISQYVDLRIQIRHEIIEVLDGDARNAADDTIEKLAESRLEDIKRLGGEYNLDSLKGKLEFPLVG